MTADYRDPARWAKLTAAELWGADYALRVVHASPFLSKRAASMVVDLIRAVEEVQEDRLPPEPVPDPDQRPAWETEDPEICGTIVLRLTDRRDVTVPLSEGGGWRKILACDYPGRWWTDGWIAVSLRRDPEKSHIYSPMPTVPVFSSDPFRHCMRPVVSVESLGLAIRLIPGDGGERPVIHGLYLPLVWAPEAGVTALVGPTAEDPVLGVRAGKVVAVVMPVRL